jgi:hypothetical protein
MKISLGACAQRGDIDGAQTLVRSSGQAKSPQVTKDSKSGRLETANHWPLHTLPVARAIRHINNSSDLL